MVDANVSYLLRQTLDENNTNNIVFESLRAGGKYKYKKELGAYL